MPSPHRTTPKTYQIKHVPAPLSVAFAYARYRAGKPVDTPAKAAAKLATLTPITRTTLYRIERGYQQPSRDMIDAAAALYNDPVLTQWPGTTMHPDDWWTPLAGLPGRGPHQGLAQCFATHRASLNRNRPGYERWLADHTIPTTATTLAGWEQGRTVPARTVMETWLLALPEPALPVAIAAWLDTLPTIGAYGRAFITGLLIQHRTPTRLFATKHHISLAARKAIETAATPPDGYYQLANQHVTGLPQPANPAPSVPEVVTNANTWWARLFAITRTAANLDRQTLATQLDRSAATIGLWETGAAIPSPAQTAHLAAVLNSPALALLTPDGPYRPYAHYGNALRTQREHAGHHINDLAYRAGVNPATVRDVETGRTRPTPKLVTAASQYYPGLPSDPYQKTRPWTDRTTAHPYPGRFIVIEGPDGSGKSTLTAAITQALATAHPDQAIVATKEPDTNSDLGAYAKQQTSRRDQPLTGLAATLLMNAARAQHLADTIIPTLTQGGTIICDRWTPSTLAYQAILDGGHPDRVSTITTATVGPVTPDLTIILDLPPTLAHARIAERTRNPDRYDHLSPLDRNRLFDWYRNHTGPGIIHLDATAPTSLLTDLAVTLINTL